MAAPPSATDLTYPDWTNLQDTWREQDAEWLRNRSVSLWASASTRTSGQASPMKGAVSARQDGYGDPEFWTGAAWEAVRYPNLTVQSQVGPPASVLLRYATANPATGIQLLNDGSVNISKTFVGTGGLGYTGDQTGIALHVGTKTVKLATDANGLTVDSPVAITGGLTTTGPATLNSLTVTGAVNFSGGTTLGAVNAASVAATGAVTGATVTGGDVILGSAPPYGTIKHRTGGTAELDVGSDSTVRVNGASMTINPPLTVAGTMQANGQATFALPNRVSQATKDPNIQVAMIIMVAGNVAPTTQNPPDGTIWYTY